MQIHRLMEIVFSLMKNERVTAKNLRERFEVSARTIYRDIDVLSSCGIPIFTDKGNGGGISIEENFRLENALLSESEKQNIITMMTAYNATINNSDTANLLEKLSGVFKTDNSFIEVDLSDWHNDDCVQRNFDVLKVCILNKRVAKISYRNANGIEQTREVEPLKLIFKHMDWYLHAFCRLKNENRLFKLARVRSIEVMANCFDRVCLDTDIAKKLDWKGDVLNIKLKISKTMKNRIYEWVEFNNAEINDEGDYIAELKIPMNEWVIGYILSFGERIEVLEPLWLKEKIRDIHKVAAEI